MRPAAQWRTLDWSQPDRVLAEQMGCTRQNVSLWRHKLSASGFQMPVRTLHDPAEWRALDWSLTDGRLAAKMGCTRQNVSYWRRRLQSLGYQIAKRRVPDAGKWRALDWSLPNGRLAKQMGCTRQNVQYWRRRVGQPRPIVARSGAKVGSAARPRAKPQVPRAVKKGAAVPATRGTTRPARVQSESDGRPRGAAFMFRGGASIDAIAWHFRVDRPTIVAWLRGQGIHSTRR
jgi:biotin operon repressor